MAKLQAISPLLKGSTNSTVIQNDDFIAKETQAYELIRLQFFSRGGLSETELAEITGLPLPKPGEAGVHDGGLICWIAPCEWVLAVPADESSMTAVGLVSKLDTEFAAITPMTDSRVVIQISGFGARRLLAMGSGVDYHVSAFNSGSCVTTKLAGIPAMVLQVEEGEVFLIIIDRSYADYLWSWMQQAATDVGESC